MSTLHEAAQEFIADYENGDLGDLKHYARALRAALAQQEQEPVASAWIRDGVMVNAFPWPPGDPRGRDEDQYWQRKGYTASPLYTHPHRRETEQALEALEYAQQGRECPSTTRQAITALRAALAQQEQEPKFRVENCILWGPAPKPYENWTDFFTAVAETQTIAGVRISDAALAQEEPVAWMVYTEDGASAYVTDNPRDLIGAYKALPLYTAPPRREWEGLTDEDMEELLPLYSDPNSNEEMLEFAAAIEAKLKKKNA